ncbi:MAG TPA: hypothetical protein VI365_26355 [Trebonia sp.]
MASFDTLALTDDEAAAVALLVGGAWGVLLPTVDESDEASVVPAILRGRRSLVARELVGPDGTPQASLAEVVKRIGGGPRAMFMLVDGNGAWIPAGLTICLYGPDVDDIEMSHFVARAGVHHFRIAPPPRQWWALTRVAESIYSQGFVPVRDTAQVPAAATLAVTRGSLGITTKSVRVAHRYASAWHDPVSGAFSSLDQAIAWLQA